MIRSSRSGPSESAEVVGTVVRKGLELAGIPAGTETAGRKYGVDISVGAWCEGKKYGLSDELIGANKENGVELGIDKGVYDEVEGTVMVG